MSSFRDAFMSMDRLSDIDVQKFKDAVNKKYEEQKGKLLPPFRIAAHLKNTCKHTTGTPCHGVFELFIYQKEKDELITHGMYIFGDSSYFKWD